MTAAAASRQDACHSAWSVTPTQTSLRTPLHRTACAGFYVLRFLLGLAEAAGSSSGGHLIAQFYPRNRLAMPFTVVVLSQIVSGLIAAPLAAGLMSLDGVAGLAG